MTGQESKVFQRQMDITFIGFAPTFNQFQGQSKFLHPSVSLIELRKNRKPCRSII